MSNAANVKMPLKEMSEGVDGGYVDPWLTMKNIESAIWKDFKFWKFSDKFKEIGKAVGYNPEQILQRDILIHVEIRNSFHHHEGIFSKEMARTIGQEHFEIRNDDGKKMNVKLWDKILLTKNEILYFCDCLEKFASGYESYIETRMKDRYYQRILSEKT